MIRLIFDGLLPIGWTSPGGAGHLFGIPESRPEAAADAVGAALEMRDALAPEHAEPGPGGKEIRIGIGMDCGEAVVGFIGSHLRRSSTAIGDTVNTASRLESMTEEKNCDILISGSVEAIQRSPPADDSGVDSDVRPRIPRPSHIPWSRPIAGSISHGGRKEGVLPAQPLGGPDLELAMESQKSHRSIPA